MRLPTSLLLTLTLLLFGCSKDAADSKDDKQKSSAKSNSTGNSESQTESNAPKLPDDLPKDVPVYQNATPTMVLKNSFRMKTSDTPQAIHDFLEAELKKQGWQLTNNALLNIQAKKDDRMLDINIIESPEEGTLINTQFR